MESCAQAWRSHMDGNSPENSVCSPSQSSRTTPIYPSPARSDVAFDSSYLPHLPVPATQNSSGAASLDELDCSWPSPSASLQKSMDCCAPQRGTEEYFKTEVQTPRSWPSLHCDMHNPYAFAATVSPDALHNTSYQDEQHSGAASMYGQTNSTAMKAEQLSGHFLTPEPMSRQQSARSDDGNGWSSTLQGSADFEHFQYALTPGSEKGKEHVTTNDRGPLIKDDPDSNDLFVTGSKDASLQHSTYRQEAAQSRDSSLQSMHDMMIEAKHLRLCARHELADVTRLQCSLCPKTFDRTYNLKQHLETHKADRSRPFTCQIHNCGQSFFRNTDLKRHDDSKHRRSKAFQCNHCKVGFPRKDSLQRHRQTACCSSESKKGRHGNSKWRRIKAESTEDNAWTSSAGTNTADLDEELEKHFPTLSEP